MKEWRFVHDGTNVVSNPFEVDKTAKTYTKYTLCIFDTLEECEAEIVNLGLEYVPNEVI